jgi:DNA-binding GntR family transcriptional regulator
MELTRIPRDRAVDAVYNVLRQAILSSMMKPGERLNVEELAEKLGVSLTPVRQAIQQLANEGLIEIKPRSGTFVASLSVRDVEETFDIRCALECLAAEKAVGHVSREDIKRLKELLKSLRKSIRNEEDRKTHERDNLEFHRVVIRASGNQRLAEMYEELNAHIKIARIHRGEADWPSRQAEEQAEHERIVAALVKGDATEVVNAMRQHIHRAKDALLSSIRTQGEATNRTSV